MKQLFGLLVILFVVGIAGFLYRNTVERPGVSAPIGACTLEAKICPDGTAVGRQGASCEFAPCLFPNVEVPSAGISFVAPTDYDATEGGVASLAKQATLDWPEHTIRIERYDIPEGKTGEEIILENTRYQPADEQAADFSRFETYVVRDMTFRYTVIERFEGLVYSSYFLIREGDVLRFDVNEKGVQNWTDPALDVDQLPEHQALRTLLQTLQTIP